MAQLEQIVGEAVDGGSAAARPGFRARHHRRIWALLWPVRTWFTRFPIHRGKGLLYRTVILPLLPPAPTTFVYKLRSGLKVNLLYRETLGTIVLFAGHYEVPETDALCAMARPGTTAIDVGANVGLCALELAKAVGATGLVIAFEPHPDTARRLRDNLSLNGVTNVLVEQSAVADRTGSITFHQSADSTLSSASVVPRDVQRSFDVPVTTIDAVWARTGRPAISVLKIDVEGGELAVLQGAAEMLADSHPGILLEAWNQEQLMPMARFLAGFGYNQMQPDGFEPRNYIFMAS